MAGKQYRYQTTNENGIDSLSEWYTSAEMAIDTARIMRSPNCRYALLQADVEIDGDRNPPGEYVQEIDMPEI
jgi:hypothetical protein